MARKRKGDPIHGWLVIDKPAGVGSTAVVGKARWALKAQKAGHAGTLDPDATGVLAVALGEATKTVPFIVDAYKCYEFHVTWGAETTTDDVSGDVLRISETRPDANAIRAALPAFRGALKQVPPAVSAVKVDGERAYDLARDGVKLDLAARDLWVEELELTSSDVAGATFTLVCGKGGYVRSIARDLGRALGCLGHVTWLRRVWSGPFNTAEALPFAELDRLAGTPELRAHVLPLELALQGLPNVQVTETAAMRLRHGNPGEALTGADYGALCWAVLDGQAVAVGTYRAGLLHPSRVFQT